MLGFSHLKESETADCLAGLIHSILKVCVFLFLYTHDTYTMISKDRGIQRQQIGLFITDGAANIQATVEKRLQYPWAHCATHMIDLIVCKALKAQQHTRDLILKVKKIAKHFQVCFFFTLIIEVFTNCFL